jgi:ABC-type multidrug transport system fused ATPase/permease subunit
MAVNGHVAYAAQTPFLIAQSVRDNILFGLPYEPELYGQVLSVAIRAIFTGSKGSDLPDLATKLI